MDLAVLLDPRKLLRLGRFLCFYGDLWPWPGRRSSDGFIASQRCPGGYHQQDRELGDAEERLVAEAINGGTGGHRAYQAAEAVNGQVPGAGTRQGSRCHARAGRRRLSTPP